MNSALSLQTSDLRYSATSKLLSDWRSLTIEQKRELFRDLGCTDPFVEEPIDLVTFVEGEYFLRHPPLSDIQYEFVQAMTDIFTPVLTGSRGKGTLKSDQYIEGVAQWGKGGGKDTCAMIIVARLVYLLGCLADPIGYFGLTPQSSIDIINVAVNAGQANNVFFGPLRRMLRRSPWFVEKLTFNDKESELNFPPIVGSVRKDGQERPIWAVNAYSGHSEQEGLEGYNLLVAILDEIDAFKSKRETRAKASLREPKTAEAIYEALSTTVQSRFPGVGKTILLSWPRYAGSFIQRKVQEGLADPRVFVSVATTWDANPIKTREMYAHEYERDPVRARAKYECKPPHSLEAFFKDEAKVLRAFEARRDQRGELAPLPNARPSPVSTNRALLGWFRGQLGVKYYIHVDLGLTRDRAGLAMAHHAGWEKAEIGERAYDVPKVCLDLVTGFEAPPGGEVDFSQVRQMIFNLKDRGFKIVQVTYDGWQSVDSIQILNKAGIEADTFSVDRNTAAYDTLQELIYGSRLDGYFHPLLIEELLQLSMAYGRKVDHPEGGSKDLADAVAGAVFAAAQEKRMEGGWLF